MRMNFEEFLAFNALAKTLLETSETDTALIITYHPEWTSRIRALLSESANNLLDSLLFSVKEDKEDNEEIYRKFLYIYEDKVKKEYEENSDLLSS